MEKRDSTAFSILIGFSLLASSMLSVADQSECRKVNIKKRFVEIPELCDFDACETWKSTAVLGKGTWNLGITFSNTVASPGAVDLPGIQRFTIVTDTFTAKDGDQLFAMNAVAINFDGDPLASGISYVLGGTGRFSGASGRLFIRIDNAAGKARLTGSLCGVDEEDDLHFDYD